MTDKLYHHGVLGMKWGVRRYQNLDGTLTQEGKERFLKVSNSKRLQKKQNRQAIRILKKRRNEFNSESAFNAKKAKKAAEKNEQEKSAEYTKNFYSLKTWLFFSIVIFML